MIQAKLPKEHSTYQEENFEERCAFWKIVCFLISFPNNQQKKFLLFAFVFRQCCENCFLQRRMKLDFFSFPERVCFANISGHWMRTLMQSGNLLKQFHQNCSLRSLRNFFVKKVFFCEIPSVIILGHFLKKIAFWWKFFGVLLCFLHLRQNFFLCLQMNFWGKFSPYNELFFFVKLRDEKSVLWRTFPVGLSNLLSMCLVEHFLEKKPNVYLTERFESCFLRKRGN